MNKRPAAPEEVEKALMEHMRYFNSNNPNFSESEESWRDRLAKAEAEGYKNEVCECGVVFLAFHNFCTCQREDCPFNCGKSLIDMWYDGIIESQEKSES